MPTKTYPKYHTPRFFRTRFNIGSGSNGDGTFLMDHNTINLTSYRTGYSNPDWRDRIRKHKSATTALEGELRDYTPGIGVQRVKFKYTTGVEAEVTDRGEMVYINLRALPNLHSSVEPNVSARFLKRINNAQTEFRGLTFLGELRESLQMLRNPAKGLRTGIDRYMNDAVKSAKRAGRRPNSSRKLPKKERTRRMDRAVADTWLEHAFGWSPLIADVKSASKALDRRKERYSSSYTRVSSSYRYVTTDIGSWADVKSQAVGRRWRVLTINTSSIRYYGQLANTADNAVESDQKLFGLRWEELVPTAWELIPYSFLVDYFTNVGDVIDGYLARTTKMAWVAKTIRKESRAITIDLHALKSEAESWPNSDNSTVSSVVQAKPAVLLRRSVDRAASSLPTPTFRFEYPGKTKQLLNISALAVSRAAGRRQIFNN